MYFQFFGSQLQLNYDDFMMLASFSLSHFSEIFKFVRTILSTHLIIYHGISPPYFKGGGLKNFGKISKGGPGKFPKFRGG